MKSVYDVIDGLSLEFDTAALLAILRDAGYVVAKSRVTEEMRRMGADELEKYDLQLGSDAGLMAEGIYKAMMVGAVTNATASPAPEQK